MSYELKSARYLAQDILKQILQPGDTAIDATMGNGHDTAFLCETVGDCRTVRHFSAAAISGWMNASGIGYGLLFLISAGFRAGIIQSPRAGKPLRRLF